MIDHDFCDCPASQEWGPLGSKVEITMPEGWQRMDAAAIKRAAFVKCGDCGKVLKYAGVVRWWDPETGRPSWRT